MNGYAKQERHRAILKQKWTLLFSSNFNISSYEHFVCADKVKNYFQFKHSRNIPFERQYWRAEAVEDTYETYLKKLSNKQARRKEKQVIQQFLNTGEEEILYNIAI